MGIRLQRRDWQIAAHLFSTRMFTTRQVADLCFEGRFAACQARLYLLRRGGLLTNSTYPGDVGCVWSLPKKTFEALRGGDSSRKYPGPLGPFQVEHLIATNDLYVELFPRLGEIAGPYAGDIEWAGEPECHRRYRTEPGGNPHVLKPDAQVSVLGHTYLVERQTARARERPEKLHDKVFGYHRYSNSPESKADAHNTCVLWACDEERDAQAVLQARHCHPTKNLSDLGMTDFHESRMPVEAGSVAAVSNFILGEAKRLGS